MGVPTAGEFFNQEIRNPIWPCLPRKDSEDLGSSEEERERESLRGSQVKKHMDSQGVEAPADMGRNDPGKASGGKAPVVKAPVKPQGKAAPVVKAPVKPQGKAPVV